MSLHIQQLSHQIADGANQRQILSNLSLSVNQGECVALMGNSGCGKTTLLNIIAGLEPIQQGDIYIAGHCLSAANDKQLSELRKKHIGIIFQQYNLLTSLTVKENIEFSAKLAERYDSDLGVTLAQQLGIAHLLDKVPAVLSGGEMQRVAIARALNAKPKLLLADEPTGNLDDCNSTLVVKHLIALVKSQNTALLMVTHSADIARHMDKIYHLRDARLSLYQD
ncbi:ABC transporter ATP-binding protein [Thalassotalea atypica]|uniref:ABC transporter ATP-binding protein n=1 Tax=Thalassotalea atypica TaxID=2054316 RepID=UPI002573CB89|nr:ABC transporter ATP-binding protein [Thalassotalea atypica]